MKILKSAKNIAIKFVKFLFIFPYISAYNNIQESICKFSHENIMDCEETLIYIINNRASFVRFGDGEINHSISNEYESDWQEPNSKLTKDLKLILKNDEKFLLTGIPEARNNDLWWRRYWALNWFAFLPLLNKEKLYGNSFVTRPEFFKVYGQHGVELWRGIWSKRKLVFITGKKSRLNTNHLLFNNAESKNIFYSLKANAYADLSRLKKEILDSDLTNESLILIALGQAGTVLGYQLAIEGYQCIDIGHITNSYDNIFRGAKRPEFS